MNTLFDYFKCIFLEYGFTSDDCDLRKNGTCDEQFYKKHGYFKGELDGSND